MKGGIDFIQNNRSNADSPLRRRGGKCGLPVISASEDKCKDLLTVCPNEADIQRILVIKSKLS